jgi:hypothetical protein
MNRFRFFSYAISCLALLLAINAAVLTGQEPSVVAREAAETRSKAAALIEWKETRRLATDHANQGAAADDEFVYGISNEAVAKLNRKTGALVALSEGKARHLNAGAFIDGKLLLAHSNYPRRPESSQLMALDPATMKLTVAHDFGESDGSLVWVLRHEGSWWANFAFYQSEKEKTYLARFDDDWSERGRWTYPQELLDELGTYSVSGGVWRDGVLLVTTHDDKKLFRLRLPETGERLELLGSDKVPFTGQGFALDPVTGGLVGIDRGKRQIVFVEAAE